MQNAKKEEIEVSFLEVALKMLLKGCTLTAQFVFYLVYLTLNLISDLLKKTLLADFSLMNRKDRDKKSFQIQILEGSKHEYIIKRSKEYNALYKDIAHDFHHMKVVRVLMSESLETELLSKIDDLVGIAEREAIKEGYKYCKAVNSNLEEADEIYTNFLADKIFRGE